MGFCGFRTRNFQHRIYFGLTAVCKSCFCFGYSGVSFSCSASGYFCEWCPVAVGIIQSVLGHPS